jgi:ABC-2 type transport system ATP-binding protein
MITVQNLRKSFTEYIALDNLSCSIEKGSIYGLVGYNGSGKTTLLKTIAGIYKATSGEVLIAGANVFDNEQIKRQIFFVPDDLYFLPQADLLKMSRFYKGYYPAWNDKFFQNLVSLFELDPHKKIKSFSKGMQRQAAIILGLATMPQYLLLDESFDGLDPLRRSLLKQLLTEYMAEKDTSIIISSHNLRELEDLCDHIGILNNKAIAYNCSIEELRANKNKYRVAFKDKIEEDAFKGIDYKSFNKSDHIITFIANGEQAEVEKQITALNPVLLECLPMTLEEIFLDEMEAKSYDFKELF